MSLKAFRSLLGWTLALPLVLLGHVHAQTGYEQYNTTRQLVEASVETPSLIERAIMRRYLAERHGYTTDGLFAQAWLASQEGNNAEAKRLYQEALKQDPSLQSAAFNLGFMLADEQRHEDALRHFEMALAADPQDQEMIRTIYFHLLEAMNDPQRATQYLHEQKRRFGADAWGVLFTEGLHAEFHGNDRESASRLYLAAAEAGGPPETIRRFMNLALDHLGEDINAVARPVLAYAQRHKSAETYRDLADRMVRLGGHADAFVLYQNSLELYPHAEAYKALLDSVASYMPDQVFDVIDRWAPYLDDNWQALATLAESYELYRFDIPRARELRRQSIELAPHGPSRSEAVRQAVTRMHERYELDAAETLLRQHADSLPTAEGRNLMSALLIENRLRAGDYATAAQISTQLPEQGVVGVNETWLADLRADLERVRRLDVQRREFYQRHPFLTSWEERFGASLVLAIEFELGSDRILPSAHPLLARAAQALNAPGGNDYVFLIEGHTDITGGDAINLPLSHRRATAVADYLSREHGIARERLQSIGHGSLHPIANNQSEDGRQRNRRVEIRPYGNVGEPEVVVSGQMDAKALALSRDGRLAATGTGPIQLWDIRRGVKIREMFRGGGLRAFSPDSRYLAVSSSYTEITGSVTNTLFIYDGKTGHLVTQLRDDAMIMDLAWSPFGDAVAYTNQNGVLRIYDVKNKRVRAVNRVGPIRSVGLVEWLPDGERIVTDQVVGGGMVVWNAADLTVQRRLQGSHWPHAMRASRDGQWLVVGDNERKIHVYDTNTWAVRSYPAPLIPKMMDAHPSRPLMVMNDFTNGDTGIGVFDIESGRFLATSNENGAQVKLGFTPDGDQIIVGSEDHLSWRDAKTLAEVKSLAGLAVESRGLWIDRANDYAITEDAEGTYVFDLNSGRRVHRMVTDTAIGWSQPDREGTLLITVDRNNQLVRFDSETFEERRIRELDFEVTQQVAADGNSLILAGIPHGQGDQEDAVGIVSIVDKRSLQERARITLPIVSERIRYGRVIEPRVGPIALDENSGLLAFTTTWQDGFGRPRQASQQVFVYRLNDGAQVSRIQVGADLNGLRFGSDGALVTAISGSGERHYDPRSAVYQKATPAQATAIIDIPGGQHLKWSRDHISIGNRRASFPDSLRRVAVHETKNLVIAQTLANELLFFDLSALEQHLTIAVKRDDQWIAYTPAGHFAASQRGTDGVYWSLGDNYLPFDSLRERMEQGRLVQQRLQMLMEGQPSPAAPDQPAIRIDPALFETPYTVRLVSASGVDTSDDTYRLRLEVTKASPDLPDPDFRYYLNGRAIGQTRGFEEEAVWDSEEILGIERSFSLQPGHNRIEAALRFRDAEIERQVVEINRSVSETLSQLSANTQLWFFGVGVSDYEITTQNLEFAHRDAEVLARKFEAQQGTLFSKVNTRVLTNDEATERNVRVELNDFLRQASAEDLIVIFLAGHGVQDNEQNLYLMTHDGDMQRPYTGMSINRFRDFLQSRPINQKAVLMMDICHAGSIGPRRRGRVTAEDAVQQLSAGTGTVVFASSTGAQSSLEDASFGGGHGAFTAALLEALDGKADREAGNRDGFNSIHEIISYTSRRVPQITNGAQHPTVPMLENVRDFPVTAGRP